MTEHEQYEMLCALAVTGEVSDAELQDLRCHLTECSDCRDRLFDFAQLSAQALPLLGDRHSPVNIPGGMTERFQDHARRYGIPLRSPLVRGAFSWMRPQMPRMVWIGAMLGVVSILFVLSKTQLDKARMATMSSALSAAVEHPSPSPQMTSSAAVAAPASERASANAALVERLQEQIATLKRDNLDTSAERDRLTAKLATLSADLATLRGDSTQQASAIAAFKQQLEQKQQLEMDNLVSLAQSEDQIKGLQGQLAQRDEEIGQYRSQLSASNQARDLIVARNLHIIDVHDSNGSGTHQAPFGRIFYTEGKSLVFYAYDLQKATIGNTRLAFHVWGGQLGDEDSVKSLGIFRNESANDGRWVITCDDPQVLAQVNTVFVTAENDRRKSEKPRGKRMLYAFLGDRPNHP
jgi:hypothetical protein